MLAGSNRLQRTGTVAAIAVAGLCMGLLATRPPAAPPPPDTAVVQAAYDAERANGSPRHADDLLIRTADCSPMSEQQRYGCQISYVRKSNATGRLYFDVISIEAQGRHWKLLSGLCRGNRDIPL